MDANGKPTVRRASDDMNSGAVDAKLTYTSPTGEWMTVIVVGHLDVEFPSGTYRPPLIQVIDSS